MGSAVVSPCSGLVTHPDVKDAWADAGSTRLTRSGRWSNARFGSVPLVRRRDTRASPRGVKTMNTKILHTALTRRKSRDTMRRPPPVAPVLRHRHAAAARLAEHILLPALQYQTTHGRPLAEMAAHGSTIPPQFAARPAQASRRLAQGTSCPAKGPRPPPSRPAPLRSRPHAPQTLELSRQKRPAGVNQRAAGVFEVAHAGSRSCTPGGVPDPDRYAADQRSPLSGGAAWPPPPDAPPTPIMGGPLAGPLPAPRSSIGSDLV